MRGGPQLSPSGGCGETAPACAGRSRSRPWRPGRWRPRPPGRCRTAPAARRWSRPSAAGAATASWPAGPPPALRAPPRRLPSAAPPFPRSAWCPSFSYHSAPADSRQAAFCSRCSDSIMAGVATASTAGAAEMTAQCSATPSPLCMVCELQLSQGDQNVTCTQAAQCEAADAAMTSGNMQALISGILTAACIAARPKAHAAQAARVYAMPSPAQDSTSARAPVNSAKPHRSCCGCRGPTRMCGSSVPTTAAGTYRRYASRGLPAHTMGCPAWPSRLKFCSTLNGLQPARSCTGLCQCCLCLLNVFLMAEQLRRCSMRTLTESTRLHRSHIHSAPLPSVRLQSPHLSAAQVQRPGRPG